MRKLTACVISGLLAACLLSGCGSAKTADEYAVQALQYVQNAKSMDMKADVKISVPDVSDDKDLSLSGDDICVRNIYSKDKQYTSAGSVKGSMSGKYGDDNLSWSLDSYMSYDDGKLTDYTTSDGTAWEYESSNANHTDNWTIVVRQLFASDSTTKWEVDDNASSGNIKADKRLQKPLSEAEMMLVFSPAMTGFDYEKMPLSYPSGKLSVYLDSSGRAEMLKVVSSGNDKKNDFSMTILISGYNTVSADDLAVPAEIKKHAADKGFDGSVTSNADAAAEAGSNAASAVKTEKKPADLKDVNKTKYHVVSDDKSAGIGFNGDDDFKDVSVSDGGKIISSQTSDDSISFNMMLISMDDLPAKDNAKVSHDADQTNQDDAKTSGALNLQLTDVKETNLDDYPVYWYYAEETTGDQGKVIQRYNYFVDLGNNNHAALMVLGTSGRGSAKVLSEDKALKILYSFTFAGHTDKN